MTIKSFFLITLLEWLALILLRSLYFQGNLGQGEVAYYLHFGLVAFITLVLSRRLGTISFLEAGFVSLFWFVAYLFLDLLITSAYLGTDIFKRWEMWLGYIIIMLVLFLLHKKRHVEMRKHLHH